MTCGAKTRAGTPCKKSVMIGKCRCRNHGALSKSGPDHWNWKHGNCTKLARQQNREDKARLKEIIDLGNSIGLFNKMPSFPRAK